MSDHTDPDTQDTGGDHKVLKAVVITLGVLLIIGFIALIGGVVYQVTSTKPSTDRPAPASLANNVRGGDILLPLPPGAEIIQVDLDGDRAAVLVQQDDDPDSREILIVDLVSGRVVFRLRAQVD